LRIIVSLANFQLSGITQHKVLDGDYLTTYLDPEIGRIVYSLIQAPLIRVCRISSVKIYFPQGYQEKIALSLRYINVSASAFCYKVDDIQPLCGYQRLQQIKAGHFVQAMCNDSRVWQPINR